MATATIRDVARHAAVSVASASRALNGHASVAPGTRDRVIAAATALDYVPHLGARSLSTRRSNSIGVVLPDLFGEFFSEVIRGLDFAAHRRGLQLLLSNMHGATDETATAIRAMRGRVDGLIIMSPEADGAFLDRHLPLGLPTVVLNGRGGTTGQPGGHAGIGIDGRAGAAAAARHLVAQGCTRLAHVRGPHGNADADDRADAFRATVAALLPTPVRVFDGDFGEQSGIDAAEAIVAARGGGEVIDGIFCANDIMAIGCMSTLVRAGVSVPHDIAIVGFDDVPVAHYVTPGLTSLGVDMAALGERTLDLLVAAITQATPIAATPELLIPSLVVRASSARRPEDMTTHPGHREKGRLK
ncbi:LacI family DNA-binding transcriptional regulator [Sphingomonas sp. Leaf17]|uniref:LacI family DNA-binding transcriptional regulator n=1 Tax=Sphingomonas sp. Leaf17 TaxID=1735683 RepID=UPI0009E7278B|nr:LacI family DNA-binding transcriptional regulator [Sphingomonas sp. Leaf17]